MAELNNLLEAESSSTSSSSGSGGIMPDLTKTGPDIPALREELALLVSMGKAHRSTTHPRAAQAVERQRRGEVLQAVQGIHEL